MLMALGYLGVNLVCLLVVTLTQYHRLWRLFTAQMAVTCWQIGVLLFVPITDRTAAIHWWLPGDIALLALTAAAVLEVLWRAMGRFPTPHKVGVLLGFVGGFTFAGMSMRWMLPMATYSDWFAQVKSDRIIVNLYIATCALIATEMMHSLNRGKRLWKIRLHGALICALACGHVIFADLTHWSSARTAYRLLEVLCCAGWITVALWRRYDWIVPAIPDVSASILLGPGPHPPTLRIAPHTVRAGFGSHHSLARARVLPPAIHAGTR